MVDYGVHTFKCPSCGCIVENVEARTQFPPWFAMCRCGKLITLEDIVKDEDK